MTALAAYITDSHVSALNLERMLSAVEDSGTGVEALNIGPHRLGVASNPSLPGQSTLHYEDGWAAAFVGIVDNPDEFSGNTPGSKVIRLVRDFGPEGIGRLRGAFALVVTDGRRAWCARDHVGLEPLFYRATANALLIGTEIKQVLAGHHAPAEPDIEIVEATFFGESYPEVRTAYAGVNRLNKGSFLAWSDGALKVTRYWDPTTLLESADLTSDELQEQFDYLFSQAVKRVLTGKDAVSLSGGVDSSAIAAYAAQQIDGRRLGAISALYPDQPTVNESERIRGLAREFDLDLHTYVPQPLHLGRLEEWVRTFDGPWSAWHPGNSEATYRQVRQSGYTHMLTGEFAEQVTDVNRGVLAHLIGRGRIKAAQSVYRQMRDRGSPAGGVAKQAVAAFIPRFAAAIRRYRQPLAVIPPWMDPARIRKRQATETIAPRHQWRTGQIDFLDIPMAALGAYRMLQSRNSVRVRFPFADVELWEFWISLPAEIKHPNGRSKTLLRRLLRGRVPDSVLDARKVVFNEYITHSIDYTSLRKWLVRPTIRLPGIDYPLLADRLNAQQMTMSEFMWSKDLATSHAFLSLWEPGR